MGASFSTAALAGEGGGSTFLQGTYPDFSAAVRGPAGVYYRNDLVWYDAGIGPRPLGGLVNAGVDETLWLSISKIAWMTDAEVFGGKFGLSVAIPLVFDVDIDARATVPGFGVFSSAAADGFSDPKISAQLNWTNGAHRTTTSLLVVAPWGSYENDRVVNLSRNYWTVDPNVAYTYLSPGGFEFSTVTGVQFNLENPKTNYTTGKEFHVDWMLAQHFSKTFAVGLTGYWLQQFTDDKGNIPPFLDSGFRGRGVGIGPALTNTVTIGGHHVTFVAKWLHDVDTRNRLDGDLVMLSFATKLGREAPPPAAADAARAKAAPVLDPSPPPAPALPRPAPPPDSDGDGVPDVTDACPSTARGDRVDSQGYSCDVTVRLHFANDSDQITNEDRRALDGVADTLRRLRSVSGEFVGYTDSVGSDAYNLGLSQRRAHAVLQYLASKGILTDRLAAVGHGEADPIGDNATEQGRAQNRRVVLRRTDCN